MASKPPALRSVHKHCSKHLSLVLQKRSGVKASRAKENRDAVRKELESAPSGSNEWEKTISMIDFGENDPSDGPSRSCWECSQTRFVMLQFL